MRCPSCGCEDDRVIDSRASRDRTAIRRRRECVACQRRFTTYEYIETSVLSVVKSDGRREAFQRDKLLNGLLKACEKRPVSHEQIDQVADAICGDLMNGHSTEVTSGEIGDLVMRELEGLDPVAYVRFASVYRQFTDVQQFQEVISGFLQPRQPARAPRRAAESAPPAPPAPAVPVRAPRARTSPATGAARPRRRGR